MEVEGVPETSKKKRMEEEKKKKKATAVAVGVTSVRHGVTSFGVSLD